jgi:hypothetical protein
MKNVIILSFLFIATIANAQQGKFRRMDPSFRSFKHDTSVNKRLMIQNLKIKYLTDSLAMTSTEAEAFWPVYNEFIKSFKDLRTNRTINEIKFEEDLFNLRKSYFKKLTNVFKSEDKANKVLRLDREFMKTLIRRGKNRRKQHRFE